jgi:hypothetical protein
VVPLVLELMGVVLTVVVLFGVINRLVVVVLPVVVGNGWLENGWTVDIEDDVEDGYRERMLRMGRGWAKDR